MERKFSDLADFMAFCDDFFARTNASEDISRVCVDCELSVSPNKNTQIGEVWIHDQRCERMKGDEGESKIFSLIDQYEEFGIALDTRDSLVYFNSVKNGIRVYLYLPEDMCVKKKTSNCTYIGGNICGETKEEKLAKINEFRERLNNLESTL